MKNPVSAAAELLFPKAARTTWFVKPVKTEKNQSPQTLTKYLVIVINERNVESVTPVESLEAGITYANSLLNEILQEYKGYEYDEFSEWERATDTCRCAWCNYNGNWDAHVVKL